MKLKHYILLLSACSLHACAISDATKQSIIDSTVLITTDILSDKLSAK